MTRRGYPILGPVQLKLSDATKRPSKPVYLRVRILGGRSRDQSGVAWDLDLDLDLDPESWIPVPQILNPGSQYLRS